MSDHHIARDKAARLLKKQGSVSSLASSDRHEKTHKVGSEIIVPISEEPLPTQREWSMSTVSFMDEPGHDEIYRPPVKYENTYQLNPMKKFPYAKVRTVIKDVLESYLAEEKYEPDLCRQMSKTISEVIKARVKEMMIPRYKIICLVHIGQQKGEGLRVGSRCLWDASADTFSTFEFRNRSLFAIGSVYGVYYE